MCDFQVNCLLLLLSSDTLSIVFHNNSIVYPLTLNNKGIAWDTDVDSKFDNPANNSIGK